MSEQLINNMHEAKPSETPIVEEKQKAVKPDERWSTDERKKRFENDKEMKQTNLLAPGAIVEMAMRDALLNQREVTEELDQVIKNFNLSDQHKKDVYDYYEKVLQQNRRYAQLLNKVVDEVGNGFENFQEAFKYMSIDMPKAEVYQLKRYARKAGFDV